MKFSKILMAAAVAVAMTACGNAKTQSDDAQQADSAAQQTEQQSQDLAKAEDQGAVIELEAGDQIIPETNPVVIDFGATWCVPCNKFKPAFHKLAEERANDAVFTYADVDVCKALAEKYGVTNIPAVFIIYPESTGKQPVSNVGAMTEEEFREFLNANL